MRTIYALVTCASLAGLAVSEVHTAEPPVAVKTEVPSDWIDSATGHRVVRLSADPGTRSLYFHQNSITPDGRFVTIGVETAAIRCPIPPSAPI